MSDHELSDMELQKLIAKLKTTIAKFPEGTNSLEYELESSAKHIPAYIKIVKSHLEQLSDVLKLESHNNRTLETAGLAQPVQQLITLFKELQDGDIELLEELSITARNWQSEYSKQASEEEHDQSTQETTTTVSEV